MKRAALAANLLAISRVLLIPPFILCIIFSQRDGVYLNLARVLLLYGVVSDILDGRLGALAGNNPIGQFLDPLADKLCIAAIYISLSLVWHNPPLWLTSIVVGRFLVVRLLWLVGFLRAKEKLHSFLQKRSILTKSNLWGKTSPGFAAFWEHHMDGRVCDSLGGRVVPARVPALHGRLRSH